jgi:hypothetical protein
MRRPGPAEETGRRREADKLGDRPALPLPGHHQRPAADDQSLKVKKMKKKRPPGFADQGRLMVKRPPGHEDREQLMMKRLPGHEDREQLMMKRLPGHEDRELLMMKRLPGHEDRDQLVMKRLPGLGDREQLMCCVWEKNVRRHSLF